MSFRIEDQPEYAGPASEDDFGTPQAPSVSYPASARPAKDPSLAAIEANIEAERRADMFKSAPADATEVT